MFGFVVSGEGGLLLLLHGHEEDRLDILHPKYGEREGEGPKEGERKGEGEGESKARSLATQITSAPRARLQLEIRSSSTSLHSFSSVIELIASSSIDTGSPISQSKHSEKSQSSKRGSSGKDKVQLTIFLLILSLFSFSSSPCSAGLLPPSRVFSLLIFSGIIAIQRDWCVGFVTGIRSCLSPIITITYSFDLPLCHFHSRLTKIQCQTYIVIIFENLTDSSAKGGEEAESIQLFTQRYPFSLCFIGGLEISSICIYFHYLCVVEKEEKAGSVVRWAANPQYSQSMSLEEDGDEFTFEEGSSSHSSPSFEISKLYYYRQR